MNFKEILNMNNVFQKLRTMFYSYSKACSSSTLLSSSCFSLYDLSIWERLLRCFSERGEYSIRCFKLPYKIKSTKNLAQSDWFAVLQSLHGFSLVRRLIHFWTIEYNISLDSSQSVWQWRCMRCSKWLIDLFEIRSSFFVWRTWSILFPLWPMKSLQDWMASLASSSSPIGGWLGMTCIMFTLKFFILDL